MKKLIVFILILTAILISFLTVTSSDSGNYINAPKYTHSFTKAICTEENFCQDYEIFCYNSNMMKISPITGAAVQFPRTWEDPRSEEMRNSLC